MLINDDVLDWEGEEEKKPHQKRPYRDSNPRLQNCKTRIRGAKVTSGSGDPTDSTIGPKKLAERNGLIILHIQIKEIQLTELLLLLSLIQQ